MEEQNEQRIENLEKLKSFLTSEYESLENNTSQIYQTYLEQLEYIRNQKLQTLEKWLSDEKESIQRFHEGQYTGINNDYTEKLQQLRIRTKDFIIFKYHLLNKHFPEAHNYFHSHCGYNPPFSQVHQDLPLQFTPDIAINTRGGALLSPEEVSEDQQVIDDISNNQAKLISQISLLQGELCSIDFPNIPPLVGIIGKITTEFFILNVKMEKH